MPALVDGDSLTYQFFKELLITKRDLAVEFSRDLILRTAIWLSPDVYRRWPVLLPWVVRADCRKNIGKNRPERWGSPNDDGYFQDDNSMVKGLVKPLEVDGPKGSYVAGKRIGRGWVASHIWRKITPERIANTYPMLNTFVPNLVWLPRQIAKLSDQEGGAVQQTLQAMSRVIYEHAEVETHLAPVVQEAWRMLPPAKVAVDVPTAELNWFPGTDDFVQARKQATLKVIEALRQVEAGEPITPWRICHRYIEELPKRAPDSRRLLIDDLLRYTNA
jgi:hypothetical protein